MFETKKDGVLSVYYTAGYPERDDTVSVLMELDSCGVDMVEIGMPFSDPVADGPLLEQANQQAIRNGMSLTRLFGQLEGIREKTGIPLLLMGYLNPVLRYGVERFCSKATETGIDGLILPDMPVEEYLRLFKRHFEENGLCPVFLITPQTPEERIRMIDQTGKGFLYMVSVSSTTGERQGFGREQIEYFRRVEAMDLNLPRLIGFGISDRRTYEEACRHASGAIIGTAFVRNIADPAAFIRSIRN